MSMPRALLILSLLLLFAACTGDVSTPSGDPTALPKLLATVFLSPTPDAGQQQATRLALRPTLTPQPTWTPLPPTPYVGVFLGEVQPDDGGAPLLMQPPAAPTPNPIVLSRTCTVPPDPVFGTEWNTTGRIAQTLACPIQQMFGFDAQAQVFERGVIYRRKDNGEIWGIAPGGQFTGRYWYLALAPVANTAGFVAPGGLRVPSGDFGGLWAGVPGVSDALGFATTDPQDVQVQIQRFDGGTLLRDATVGQVFAFYNNGDAYGPYSR